MNTTQTTRRPLTDAEMATIKAAADDGPAEDRMVNAILATYHALIGGPIYDGCKPRDYQIPTDQSQAICEYVIAGQLTSMGLRMEGANGLMDWCNVGPSSYEREVV